MSSWYLYQRFFASCFFNKYQINRKRWQKYFLTCLSLLSDEFVYILQQACFLIPRNLSLDKMVYILKIYYAVFMKMNLGVETTFIIMLKVQNLNMNIKVQIVICSLIVILTLSTIIADIICRLWTYISLKVSLYFFSRNNKFKMQFVDNSSVIICSVLSTWSAN